MGKEFAEAFEDGTALHPLGRNPGDVVQDEDWRDRQNPVGRPAFPPQHRDKITPGYNEGKGQIGQKIEQRKDRGASRPLVAPNNPWGNRAGGGDNQEKHRQAIEMTEKGQFYHEHGGARKAIIG